MRMLTKPGLDVGVEFRDLLLEGHHPLREAGHHGGGQLLTGQRGVLGLGCLDGGAGDAAAPLALRFFSHVSMRFAPVRRMPVGV